LQWSNALCFGYCTSFSGFPSGAEGYRSFITAGFVRNFTGFFPGKPLPNEETAIEKNSELFFSLITEG
jgi:hypothetical protein